jgi:mannose-6-phosphate isomerase-like protein (cupin superfamily)
MSYSHKNLRQVEDAAAKHGHSEMLEARFPRQDLDAETTGLSYLVLRPGKRQPFAHRHHEAEEIYVVLSGGGYMKLDDEVLELEPMDAVRVAPEVTRAFEAGSDGIELLVFGPRHDGDAEIVPEFWGS